MVKLGRSTQGKPISCSTSRASARLCTVSPAADLQADLPHRLLEFFAILGLANHVGPGADHLHAVLCQHAVLVQFHRQVQGRLAAQRRQQGVGPLGLDHLGDDFPGQRLDVGPIGHARIGHDRGRIRIDQHDLVAFFAQGFAGLGSRIIELAGLTDDDRARSQSAEFCECRRGAARQ